MKNILDFSLNTQEIYDIFLELCLMFGIQTPENDFYIGEF